MRERLKPYIKDQMKIAHEKGHPVMRPLFFDFPEDKESWNIEDEYMFGPDILVAPVLYEGARKRMVYLPSNVEWKEVYTGKIFKGGQLIDVDAPLNVIPIFLRNGVELPIKR